MNVVAYKKRVSKHEAYAFSEIICITVTTSNFNDIFLTISIMAAFFSEKHLFSNGNEP